MTTYAQMLELSDPMDCHVRNLGEGSIRVLMWGSVNANPQFLVRLYGSGKLVVVDMMDLRVAHNPGDERDGVDIPNHWDDVRTFECQCGKKARYKFMADIDESTYRCECGKLNILWSKSP